MRANRAREEFDELVTALLTDLVKNELPRQSHPRKRGFRCLGPNSTIQIEKILDENTDALITFFHNHKALGFSEGVECSGIVLARPD